MTPAITDTAHLERLDFYSRVLNIAHSRPSDDLRYLCDAWRHFSKADWVWLWTFNDFGEPPQWEIAATSPHDGADVLPTNLAISDQNCIAELANSLNQPIEVRDLTKVFIVDGRTYRVASASDLTKMGCNAFVCVPLLISQPFGSENSRIRHLRSAMCLHYRSGDAIPDQPGDPVMLMGRLTATKILASYEAEQREILFRLNALADRYLGRRTRNHAATRQNYCEAVIQLLRDSLKASYASIFYRSPAQLLTEIACLASTGLYRTDGTEIPRNGLSQATYKRGECVTGKVFETGIPHISKIGAKMNAPKFRETPVTVRGNSVSWIIYPLTSEIAPQGQSEGVGIIRCGDCRDSLVQNRPANFNPAHADILDFVARQITPILETMAANIERERAISVVKHDLDAALEMVSNSAFSVSRYLLRNDLIDDPEKTIEVVKSVIREEGLLKEVVDDFVAGRRIADSAELDLRSRKLGSYLLGDILVSCQTLHKLVAELDPDLTRRYHPTATLLEGEFLGRVVAMWAHLAAENEMRIRFRSLQGVIPKLYIDPVLIERVVWNLLSNAVKYGDAGSIINVEPRFDQLGYYVEISNRGKGISEEEAKRVFEGTYRAPWARKRGPGKGLGLKIAKGIMERHGGRLDLLSKEGPTTFSMFFPKELTYRKNP